MLIDDAIAEADLLLPALEHEPIMPALSSDERYRHLGGPILKTLCEGMAECFPGLEPGGVNEKSEAVYRLANTAAALEATEEALLNHSEAMGMRDVLSTGSVQSLH